jgi:hypothetical protein
MSRSATLRSLCLACAAAALAGTSPSPVAASSSEGQAALDEANRRWRGARCRTRQELTVRKARDGWSDCEWLFWSPEGGNSRVRVEVSDGAAVHRVFRRGVLPVGTELVAAGWAVEEGGSDLYLELELVGLPVRARVFYYDDWVGRVSVDRLADFERWARFELVELVSVPSEQLVAAPATPTPVPRPPRPTPAPVLLLPELGLVTAEVRPAQVRPGGEVRLVVTYEVAGLGSGEEREVTEIRRIADGARELETFQHTLRRPAGTVTSELPVRVPANVAPGVYSVGATVRLAGAASASDTAFFLVTTAGGTP